MAVVSSVCTQPSANATSRSVALSVSYDGGANKVEGLHGTFRGAMPIVF